MQRQIIKSLLGVSAYKYGAELVLFLGSLVVARLLLPQDYGLVGIASIFYGFLIRFADMGLSEAVVREKEEAKFISGVHQLFCLKGVILALIMAALAYPVRVLFHKEELSLICLSYALSIGLYSLSKAYIAVSRKREYFKLMSKIELSAAILQVVITVFVAYFYRSYWALVLPQLIIPVFYLAVYQLFVGGVLWANNDLKLVWSRVKSLFFSVGGVGLVDYIHKNADSFYIGKWYGTSDLGFYNKAFSLVNMPITFIVPQVNAVVIPIIQNVGGQTKGRGEFKLLIKLCNSVLTLPVLCFLLFSQEIVSVLWGAKWMEVSELLSVFSLIIIPQMWIQITYSMFIIAKRERLMLWSVMVNLIIMLISVVIGGSYSLMAMVYCYVGATIFIAAPLSIYYGYYKSLVLPVKDIMRLILPWLLAIGGLYMFKILAYQNLLIAASLVLLVYGVINFVNYYKAYKCNQV